MKKIELIFLFLLLFGITQIVAAACGDVNSDEMVDIVDALLIAQDYVNLNPANYDPTVADVNNDGAIDIVDALLVAQYYVDLINELNCGEPPVTPTPITTSVPTVTPTVACCTPPPNLKTRVIVTTDGEIDDKCSLVRLLLYANDFDIQGIVTSFSYHDWFGPDWADWQELYLDMYEDVYPNLRQHDPDYPTPAYIRAQFHLGNVKYEGDMDAPTAGSNHIVSVLLDASDDRPIWLQAWSGVNTIARALKTIEDDYPDRMAEVAAKIRLFLIWEQDSTFQDYIRPNWEKPYNITTIISDQFITFGYWWEDWDFPDDMAYYFSPSWMKSNLLENHGPLLALYNAQSSGAFNSEGESPSFLHAIPNGLRSLESPDWGGWGGRYKLIRENTWLDPVPVDGYSYPSGRWYTSSAWGRKSLRNNSASQDELREYFKPITRWIDVIQNDFAARADWCVKSYEDANHEPVVLLMHPDNLTAQPGATVQLDALGTTDPDDDQLTYKWWQYHEADSVEAQVSINNSNSQRGASFTVPNESGKQVHIICEVKDNGTPVLTRYRRVVIYIN